MPLPSFKTLTDRANRKMKAKRLALAKTEIKPCMGYPHCNGGDEVCKNCDQAESVREARDAIAYEEIEALGYTVSYNPPPIPQRSCDYQFAHSDYDGPGDPRCGCAPCPELALERIKEIEEIEEEWE